MKNLYLFDIDGTLITGASNERFTRTINKIHGLKAKLDKDYSGYTDYLILAALLKNEGWGEQQIIEAMPKLLKELDNVHAETFDVNTLRVLPGVKELLKSIKVKGHTLGLITGNLKSVAERKLKALGLWSYFSVGGFGSDPHKTRGDLVIIAIERIGFKNKLNNVYVIGDTVKDIEAAHEAGVKNSVGVANGFRKPQELIDAGAKIVLDDFKGKNKILKKLGVV